MDLGSTIYRLRTAKNLSQEELAERLEVSRQSVSKWENNTATPDLEKLVKLCDIFEVSLDELAGRSKPEPQEPTGMAVPVKNPALPQRKIVGYILLGLSVAAALLLAFLYGLWDPYSLGVVLPLFCCSLVCLSNKSHAGYRCFWLAAIFANYLLYSIYRIIAVRLRGPGSFWDFILFLNTILLLFGVFVARISLHGVSVPYRKTCWFLLPPAWIGYFLLFRYSLKVTYSYPIRNSFGYSAPPYFHFCFGIVLIALLAVLFTVTYLHLRSWKQHQKEQNA